MVEPFRRVSDVHVNMTVTHPRPTIGLGNLLILHKKPADTPPTPPNNDKTQDLTPDDIDNGIIFDKTDTVSGANYREYTTISAIEAQYEQDTDVHKKAEAYFSQSNHSDRVAVLTYPDGKLADALKAFWYNNWVFGAFAENGVTEAESVSNIFEANEDHMLLVQSNTLEDFRKFKGQNYVINIKHDTSEPMATALIGELGNLTVGSITWKFKKLKGITPEDITSTERDAYTRANVVAYINVGGVPETSAGTVASGEYIDSIHGDIWVKTNIAGTLQRLLQTSDKIPYNQSGINLIAAQVNSVLAQAYAQGIIKEDDATNSGIFSVDPRPRSEQSAIDLSNRHYGGINFSYARAGAIEDVTVNGTVASDTIMQILA